MQCVSGVRKLLEAVSGFEFGFRVWVSGVRIGCGFQVSGVGVGFGFRVSV